MSIDPDGDSQMSLDATSQIQVATPSTPPHASIPHDIRDLSPPNSQGGVALPPTSMPTVAASASGANANGKRPLDTLDGNADPATDLSASNISLSSVPSSANANGNSSSNGVLGSGNGSGNAAKSTGAHPSNLKVHTHGPSGYTWSRSEDGPGYAWQNRKAQEEANRAWEMGIVAKDRTVQNRYGDPFDVADREAAMMKRSEGVEKAVEA